MKPLVTVICLCYNHAPFVEKALGSVFKQNYSPLEVIVVDDASTDGSKEIISTFKQEGYAFTFIDHEANKGNCRAFNHAFEYATGQYIVDFSTDDVMEFNRISCQVAFFEQLDASYGVIFSDAFVINTEDRVEGTFYKRNQKMELQENVPSGDVYKEVLRRYFICPPTMMFTYEVLEKLGGYDESLTYEDFDFWVRSARIYNYGFQDGVFTYRRRHNNALSASYRFGLRSLLESTYKVCLKAKTLNESRDENKALAKRVRHEMRHAWTYRVYDLVIKYYELLQSLHAENHTDRLVRWLAGKGVSFSPLLRLLKK